MRVHFNCNKGIKSQTSTSSSTSKQSSCSQSDVKSSLKLHIHAAPKTATATPTDVNDIKIGIPIANEPNDALTIQDKTSANSNYNSGGGKALKLLGVFHGSATSHSSKRSIEMTDNKSISATRKMKLFLRNSKSNNSHSSKSHSKNKTKKLPRLKQQSLSNPILNNNKLDIPQFADYTSAPTHSDKPIKHREDTTTDTLYSSDDDENKQDEFIEVYNDDDEENEHGHHVNFNMAVKYDDDDDDAGSMEIKYDEDDDAASTDAENDDAGSTTGEHRRKFTEYDVEEALTSLNVWVSQGFVSKKHVNSANEIRRYYAVWRKDVDVLKNGRASTIGGGATKIVNVPTLFNNTSKKLIKAHTASPTSPNPEGSTNRTIEFKVTKSKFSLFNFITKR